MTAKLHDCCAVGAADNGGRYDLAVIGAGSAGFSAAITAAELGARVALIGHGTIGGTCVNTGCVPSKNLIRATETLHHAKAASRFAGIRGDGRVEDWHSVDLAAMRGVARINGRVVGEGRGDAAMGHPLEALAWVANHLAAHGRGLVFRDVVITGSMITTKTVQAGDLVNFEVDRLGPVELRVD